MLYMVEREYHEQKNNKRETIGKLTSIFGNPQASSFSQSRLRLDRIAHFLADGWQRVSLLGAATQPMIAVGMPLLLEGQMRGTWQLLSCAASFVFTCGDRYYERQQVFLRVST